VEIFDGEKKIIITGDRLFDEAALLSLFKAQNISLDLPIEKARSAISKKIQEMQEGGRKESAAVLSFCSTAFSRTNCARPCAAHLVGNRFSAKRIENHSVH
jgi:hypothetical protein